MVSKGSERVVLWPRYFDQRLSRAEGRRVPKAMAVREPDVKWLESAAKKAGFDVTVESGAKHPSIPYKAVGRVLVTKSGSKETIVRKVAAIMSS